MGHVLAVCAEQVCLEDACIGRLPVINTAVTLKRYKAAIFESYLPTFMFTVFFFNRHFKC